MDVPSCKLFSISLLCGLWTLGFLPLRVAAKDQPEPTLMAKEAQDDDEDEDDCDWDGYREERFANPRPLFAPELLPGFRMKHSVVSRLYFRNKKKPNDCIREEWAKGPPAGFTRSTIIRIALYPRKHQGQAFKTAKRKFMAVTDKNQELNVVAKPNPGSFSGQPIGDYCWAFVVRMSNKPRGSVNRSASLLVVEKDCLFDIQVTGSGETGAGIEDRYIEELAKALVGRLKTWQRPQ